MEMEIDIPTCFCQVEAALRTSWTNSNPGRRFFGCRNIQVRRSEGVLFVMVIIYY